MPLPPTTLILSGAVRRLKHPAKIFSMPFYSSFHCLSLRSLFNTETTGTVVSLREKSFYLLCQNIIPGCTIGTIQAVHQDVKLRCSWVFQQACSHGINLVTRQGLHHLTSAIAYGATSDWLSITENALRFLQYQLGLSGLLYCLHSRKLMSLFPAHGGKKHPFTCTASLFKLFFKTSWCDSGTYLRRKCPLQCSTYSEIC